jgi:hypothetical protein
VSILFEVVGQFLFEVLAYGTGKICALVLVPHIGIEPFEQQRSAPRWKWRGFSYLKGGRRFLYTESIQLLGLGIWIIIALVVIAFSRWT